MCHTASHCRSKRQRSEQSISEKDCDKALHSIFIITLVNAVALVQTAPLQTCSFLMTAGQGIILSSACILMETLPSSAAQQSRNLSIAATDATGLEICVTSLLGKLLLKGILQCCCFFFLL